MKRTFLAALGLMLLFSFTAFSQTESKSSGTGKLVANEVFATVAKWAEAVRKRDREALSSIFEDGLIVTTYDGQIRGKSGELDVLKPDPKVQTTLVENQDLKVRVFGNSALVTAMVKMRYFIDRKENNTAFRYTAMFVKSDGRWRMIALHTAKPIV